MIVQIIIFLIIALFLNFLLYLSMSLNKNISYLILTLIIFLNFFSIRLYKKIESKNYRKSKNEISAEDHPIIKAARERLKK